MYPPPTTASLRGCFGKRSASSEVMNGTSTRPSMSGIRGRVPAAITIVSALMRSSPACRTLCPTNLPVSLKTVMFGCWRFPCSMASASASTVLTARFTMKSQSTADTWVVIPKSSARRIVCMTSALWISILDGIQPRFRQVPPKGPCSTTATESPRSAASDETSRPDPEPMTITSNDCIRYILVSSGALKACARRRSSDLGDDRQAAGTHASSRQVVGSEHLTTSRAAEEGLLSAYLSQARLPD